MILLLPWHHSRCPYLILRNGMGFDEPWTIHLQMVRSSTKFFKFEEVVSNWRQLGASEMLEMEIPGFPRPRPHGVLTKYWTINLRVFAVGACETRRNDVLPN